MPFIISETSTKSCLQKSGALHSLVGESGINLVNVNAISIITWANLKNPRACILTKSSFKSSTWPSSVALIICGTDTESSVTGALLASVAKSADGRTLDFPGLPPPRAAGHSTASLPGFPSALLEDSGEWANLLGSCCQDLGITYHLESQTCSSSDKWKYLACQAFCRHYEFQLSKYPYRETINYTHLINGDIEAQ